MVGYLFTISKAFINKRKEFATRKGLISQYFGNDARSRSRRQRNSHMAEDSAVFSASFINRNMRFFASACNNSLILQFRNRLRRFFDAYNPVFANMLSNDAVRASLGTARRYTYKVPKARSYGRGMSRFGVLPTFTSLLCRLAYLTDRDLGFTFYEAGDSAADVRRKRRNFDYNYSKIALFWRALIFFRFYKKTFNIPDCAVLLNPDNHYGLYNDFNSIHVPVICASDSVSELQRITYPLPSNDDSLILLIFYVILFLNCCDAAMTQRHYNMYV